ncbi:MAG: MFS transporter [Candidatus Edwardsbacteria bacterium]
MTITLERPIPFRLPHTFTALRHRNFRLFWFGQLISLIGTWMQSVAQGWLVLQLTNSPFKLGFVATIASLPMLFLSPIGGAVADRLSKKNLIILTQIIAMILAFLIAGLISLGWIRYWQIMVIAGMLGVVNAFDAPARQSFVIEMVGRADLMNAIALNSSMFNASRIIGPAIAGLLIAAMGLVGCFYLNGISFLAVIVGLFLMRGKFEPKASSDDSLLLNLKEGLRYVRRHQKISTLIEFTAVVSIFGMSYAMLMPVFARDILYAGPRGLGILMSATGTGALAGALTLATLGDFKKRGYLILGGGFLFSIMLILFSFSRSLILSMVFLLFVGFGMSSQMASINTEIQTNVSDHLRGRVMSIYTLTFMGMMPLGSLQAGTVAKFLGAPIAVLIGGGICLLNLLFRGWRNLEMFKE